MCCDRVGCHWLFLQMQVYRPLLTQRDWGRWRSICRCVLYVGNHCWCSAGVEIILLDAVVSAQGKQRGRCAIGANSCDILCCGNSLICDTLGTNVPRGGLAVECLVSTRNQIARAPSVTYPSVYCTIRPFLDHENQQGPGSLCSDLLSTRITQGASPPCEDLGTLHTLRSPSAD